MLKLRVALLCLAYSSLCHAFIVSRISRKFAPSAVFGKKKSSSRSAKGFGKAEQSVPSFETTVERTEREMPSTESLETEKSFLQSVEGSHLIPVQELPPEERTKQILREKYGLKTLEEQKMDAKKLEQLQEQQKKMKKWTQKATEGEDIDLIAMLPPPLLIGIDRFLKAGVAITGLLFVGAGLGITLEAWSKTSNQLLPESVDQFIVTTIEPNFTTGLLVLFGFSISLGLFSAAKLGSAGAQYKEDN